MKASDRQSTVRSFTSESAPGMSDGRARQAHEPYFPSSASTKDGTSWCERAIENAGLGVWEWDLRLGQDYWSPLCHALLGLPDDVPITLQTFLKAVHVQDRERARAALDTYLAGQATSYQIDFRVPQRGSSQSRWLRLMGRLQRAEDGSPLRLSGVLRDVTDRILLEDVMAERDVRFRALVETIPQLVWSARADSSADYHNSRFYEYTGAELGALEGNGWAGFVHPEDRDAAIAAWHHAVERGNSYSTRFRIRNRDGLYRWHQVCGTCIRDPEGEISCWFGTCTDVDEVVQAHDMLARKSDLLERMVEERTTALQDSEQHLAQVQRLEAIGQLTAGVVHDFNNLLAAAAGNLELIGRATKARGDESLRQLAENGQRAVMLAGRLAAQLLAISRKQTSTPQQMEIADILGDGLGELIRHAVGKAVQLKISLASDLWPCWVDPAQFEAALLNLAINARDAMPTGGVLTITAENRSFDTDAANAVGLQPGDYILVDVIDSGTGIAPEYLSRLFEPFFTTKAAGKGTGLGLTQVHGFARQSGGTVMVRSTLGRGTTVSLCLPRREQEALSA